jgi:hypothetical protein
MSRVHTVIARRRASVAVAASRIIGMVSLVVVSLGLVSVGGVKAEGLKVHNTYGSPLETLKNTHLTTTVPDAKAFVRQTRPDESNLEYTPLTGTDPERPKPRDPKGVEALQAELEGAAAKNEVKAKGLLPRKTAPHSAAPAKRSVTAATR